MDSQSTSASRRGGRHHELELWELPPIERLAITVDEKTQLKRLGTVSSVVGVLVVVHSDASTPAGPAALNEDSVLFAESRAAIGRVFEIFGPVARPFYSVRMQNAEHVRDAAIAVGAVVFYAPLEQQFTQHVFTKQLIK